MAIVPTQNPWAFAFGIMGNIISFVVFLAPVPTFARICKKKSTEGFQSLPYITALFSATLWIYYALQKDGSGFLLITINAFGCFIETIYIALYLAFAHKKARIFTLKILILLNFVGFCSIVLVCQFLTKRSNRAKVLGGICVGFAVSVFAAPLSIIRVVVRTKSVEFMPFSLSFFLTLSAVTWLLYGLSVKDFYVALPNILGTFLGALQMILYIIYKYYKAPPAQEAEKPKTVPDHSIDIAKLVAIVPTPISETTAQPSPANHAAEPQAQNPITEIGGENVIGPQALRDVDAEKDKKPSDKSPV